MHWSPAADLQTPCLPEPYRESTQRMRGAPFAGNRGEPGVSDEVNHGAPAMGMGGTIDQACGELRVADGKEPEKKIGPKGGVKHTPGRAHDASSGPAKKKRFRKKAQRVRKEQAELARILWQEWDEMSPELRRLLGPKGEPKVPRPKDEN